MRETRLILDIYRDFVTNFLALPVIPGEKAPHERFPGADNSLTIEAMMQDGRALQAGTSHYLGQNFAKAIGIQFQNRQGNLDYVHTTSWAVTTRLLGALIMVHGDDDGMRMPPRVAPWQVVIVPILRDDSTKQSVVAYCESLKSELQARSFSGQSVRVKFDARDIAGTDKRWEWIKKGAPLLLEIGARDVEGNKVCVTRRDQLTRGKRFIARSEFEQTVTHELDAVHKGLFDQAVAFQRDRTVTTIKTRSEFLSYFGRDAENGFSSKIGFVRAKWSGDKASLTALDKLGVTVRCIPFDQDGKVETCVLTGALARRDVMFARAY